MIRAKGRLKGSDETHEIIARKVNGKWKVAVVSGDMPRGEHQRRLNAILDENPSMGGTFWPERDSELAAYNALENYYFSRLDSIDTSYELEAIPGAEGVVY